MKDLLRVADLSAGDLTHLLDLADAIRERPHHLGRVLAGDPVVCYFAKPSTRTRLSFGSAIARLGGVPEIINGDELQLGRGETIEDTARVISRYARAFVIRTFADDDVARFATAATIPVVNALTDGHHPCQALADAMTLRHHFGRLEGLRVAYVGVGNNVAHSLMEVCALAGADIVVATPPGFEPEPSVVRSARILAGSHGSSVELTDDPRQAVSGADAVYTDVWLSMGDDEGTRDVRRRTLAEFRVTPALMGLAGPGAVFLHCLPAHRGEEVAADVIDGPASLVFDQAENRMHTAQALLESLVLDRLVGAPVAEAVGA